MNRDELENKIITADVLTSLLKTNYSFKESRENFIIRVNLPNSKFWDYEREMRDELIFLLADSKFIQMSNNKLIIYYGKD